MGYTPDGVKIFYYREPNEILNPCTDEHYLYPMDVLSYSEQIYGIPAVLENFEFLLIVETIAAGGIVYYRIDRKGGYKKLIHSNKRRKYDRFFMFLSLKVVKNFD
uniref:Uncharacterized protein n=1 Tax=Panagrolaimus davidi TaxID=227884 RepID=A0A914Q5Y7_9BILA